MGQLSNLAQRLRQAIPLDATNDKGKTIPVWAQRGETRCAYRQESNFLTKQLITIFTYIEHCEKIKADFIQKFADARK